ncbi:SDR family oxidoreductase [Pseudoalteromonas shioyasakiensis]|uniref:SDR family oxidoreductase n=1 Tax=Pseudoalteromonas shioyasakiensis TaxID=1190813 RepID=A0ABT6TYU3_9GAMM|nr:MULTISPECIES: SDR family oxidoreductase [Pseudoalteromonas]MDI4668180.1 SDR family oxidoreductase [Pseudoalteromonas shioyasakiensis]MDI4672590.1 SDR family oxidoreductase [Pseudoalteromonas shioyasakiensis]MDI4684654.1 SDR family oxidoreductase [Pseudoalteromonas shioyasakiensis]MDI4703382.1 SDR family oxidoreductase [Pseudoalteromonas shioyasakiensis]NUJ19991.1 SDR family oxidoreductase [Pseudoalteromonas sp. 0802]
MSKRNALITGGARGIGAACAKALAAEGYRVFINYVNSSEVANKLADEIIANGGEAFAVKADVRDPLQVEEMINNISQHGGVDALISNANMSFTSKPFLDQTWQEFSQKLNDEMFAAYNTAQLAAKVMKEKHFGRLIFISSTLSEMPAPAFIAHGTAKGALDSFNKYLAQELGPYGITSNIVAPGLVETDATKEAPEEFKEMIRQHTPTQKIAQPEDVANTVRYLASEKSGHITGTYNPVCGGAYIQ